MATGRFLALLARFGKDIRRTVASPHSWTVLGGVVAVLALAASAFQMYQAAQLQRESVEIDRRTMLADLAMRAHEEAYVFFATAIESPIAKEIFAAPEKEQTQDKYPQPDQDVVTPEVRSAYLRLEGAVARAMLNTDPEVVACLRGLEFNAGTLLESTFPQRKSFDSENIFVALGGFPSMVERYLDGKPPPQSFEGKAKDDINPDECEAFEDMGLYEPAG